MVAFIVPILATSEEEEDRDALKPLHDPLRLATYTPISPADVIVFREGEYAVAVDGKTKEVISRSTDHSTVLQAAINHVASKGYGKVLVKTGVYELSDTVTISNDYIDVVGEGRWKTIFRSAGASPLFRIAGTSTSDRVMYIRLSDFTIQGQGKTFEGIEAKYVTFLFLEEIEWMGVFGTCLRLYEIWGVRTKNLFFFHCGAGTETYVVEILKSDTDKTTAGTHIGWRMEAMYANGVKIDGCVNQKFIGCEWHTNSMDDNPYRAVDIVNGSVEIEIADGMFGAGSGTFIYISGSNDIRIVGNRFGTEKTVNMIHVTGGSKRVIIAYNTFGTYYRVLTPVKGIAIYSDSDSDELVVIGNTAIGDRTPGSRFIETYGKARIIGNLVKDFEKGIFTRFFAEIIGNYVEGCGLDGIEAKAGGGGVVIGNFLINNGQTGEGAGIRITGNQHTVIGNVCRDNQATPTQDYGIYEGIYADENVIVGNRVREYAVAAIYRRGANTIVRYNLGYRTENSGVATLAAGDTRVTVNHGLVAKPSKVLITPLGQPPGKLWVDEASITDTSFDIVTDTAPSADLHVAWYAEV